MSKDNINQNRAQRLLFKAGEKDMAADMRYYQPELGGSRRLAKETARIVAREEADPVEVRQAGARRIVRRAGKTAALAAGVGLVVGVANHAFDNSPSFQREKNSDVTVPVGDSQTQDLHSDPTQAEVTVEGQVPTNQSPKPNPSE